VGVGVGAGGVGQAGFSTGGQMSASRCGAGGGVAHPARSARTSAPAIEDNRAARTNEEAGVGWVFLEIGIALAIAVAIVWWTLPRRPKPPKEKDEP
jgi:hypothetical protein